MSVERDSEDVKEFLVEGSAFLDDIEPALAAVRSGGAVDPEGIPAMFRAFHSIKGVSGFLSFLEVQESTHKAEEALDKVRTGKLPLDPGLAGVLLEACDLMRKFFAAIEATGEDLGLTVQKEALIARLKEYTEKVKGPVKAVAAGAGADWSKRGGFVFDFLKEGGVPERVATEAVGYIEAMELALFELLDAPTRISVLADVAGMCERFRMNAEAFGYTEAAALAGVLGESLGRARPGAVAVDPEETTANFRILSLMKSLLKLPAPEAADVAAAAVLVDELAAVRRVAAAEKQAAPQATAASEGGEHAVAGAGKKGDIRVSLDKLDKMVDLIEELGVAASSMSFEAEIQEATGEGDVRKAAGKLRQVTEELQEVAMSVRMVPLSTLFRKMVRLVGDVSSKLGKKARLEIIGEETELDKDAAEALQDPMVHLLRNCMDHGLEMPDQRKAAGKPDTGVVRLQAWYSGGEACISISDDGRGIDREKVLAKAVSQGLAAAGAVLSDAEVFAFIFQPGFSLAKEVTEFSGRGVGMDVVKKNIEKLKGKVEIESHFGKGSTFLVRIPMANALTESMLVRAGESRYVIRVSSIRETFRPQASSVTHLPDGSELISLRGGLYPIVRLQPPDPAAGGTTSDVDRGLLVLVENHGKQLALYVDEVLGKIQSIIKAPPEMLKASRTLAGYSIIGTRTDDVAWALDIDAVAAKAGVGT